MTREKQKQKVNTEATDTSSIYKYLEGKNKSIKHNNSKTKR